MILQEGDVADNSVLDEPCVTASYNGSEYNRPSSQGNEVDAQNTTINVTDESTTTGKISLYSILCCGMIEG